MPTVDIEDPASMNVLGLFLHSALQRNLIGRTRPCYLRGAMTVEADGMRATVRFNEEGALVTRSEEGRRVLVSGSLALLTEALVHRRIRALLKVKIHGSRLFALRALGALKP